MRFLFGFTLGVLLTILGSVAWLTSLGGGDYLLTLSPRFQEMQSSLGSLEKRVNDLADRVVSTVPRGEPAT